MPNEKDRYLPFEFVHAKLGAHSPVTKLAAQQDYRSSAAAAYRLHKQALLNPRIQEKVCPYVSSVVRHWRS